MSAESDTARTEASLVASRGTTSASVTSESLESRIGGTLDSHLLTTKPKRQRKKTPHELAAATAKEAAESRLYNLSLDVNNVKQQILDLTVQRDVLRTRLAFAERNARAKMLDLVKRYFDGFRRGYGTDNLSQRALVYSFATGDMSIGHTGLGAQTLLQQWQRYTEVFAIQELVLTSTEFVLWHFDEDVVDRERAIVKCAAEFHGIFTQVAVDTVFPNARSNLWRLLQILGHQMLCPMLFHVHLNKDGYMTRQDLATDFLAALQHLLGGDLVMAARFMEGARIGEESMIGPAQVHG